MRFRVKLARPVIQTAWVEVSARSVESAIAKAVEKALRLPEDGWHGAFDERYYSYDIQSIESGRGGEPAAADDIEHRYLLLRANLGTGDGELLPQPWLDDESGLLVADVCNDWLDQVADLHASGLDSFSEWLSGLEQELQASRSSKVVPFLPYLLRRRIQPTDETP